MFWGRYGWEYLCSPSPFPLRDVIQIVIIWVGQSFHRSEVLFELALRIPFLMVKWLGNVLCCPRLYPGDVGFDSAPLVLILWVVLHLSNVV